MKFSFYDFYHIRKTKATFYYFLVHFQKQCTLKNNDTIWTLTDQNPAFINKTENTNDSSSLGSYTPMSVAKSAYHFTAIYFQKQVVSISLSQKVHIGTLQGGLI